MDTVQGQVDTVEFDEPTHTYRVNGVEFPSVSTALNFFRDRSRIPRATLEWKRKIGVAAMRAIEFYEAGTLDEESIDAAVIPFLESWIRFKAVKPLRIVEAERIVYSKKHRFAGRLDLVSEFAEEPGLWVLDVKCTYAMDPVTALQTAGYAEARAEMTGEKIAKRAGLQLQPDGSIAKFYPYTGKSDFLYFLNHLQVYRWHANNRS